MRLTLAKYEAVKYACLHFHYAKAIPMALCSFNVYNDAGEWCGCIVYSPGANKHLGTKFGCRQGQVCELVRMALNGKQESTSKALALSLKLLKKFNPLLQIVVSYADCDQDHIGTIYQATNWIYEGKVEQNGGTPKFKVFGRVTHGRTIGRRKGWRQNIDWIRRYKDPSAELVYTKGKHKYLFPLTNKMKSLCKALAQPYPKQAAIAQLAECQPDQAGDGVQLDRAAQNS